jgi:hypothetical protein
MAKKKSNNTLLIILIVIAVILVISLILYFFLIKENYKNKKGGKKKKNTRPGPKIYIETDDVFLDYSYIDNKFGKFESKGDPHREIENVYHISPNGKYLFGVSKPWVKNPITITNPKYRELLDVFHFLRSKWPMDDDLGIEKPYFQDFIDEKRGACEYNNNDEYACEKMTPEASLTEWEKYAQNKINNLCNGFTKQECLNEATYDQEIWNLVDQKLIRTLKINLCQYDDNKKQCERKNLPSNLAIGEDYRHGWNILYIYDIEKRKIIDTIQNIGSCRSITSNYDGTVISFTSNIRYNLKNQTELLRNEKKERVLTYKLNPSSLKYEQFVDPIFKKNEQWESCKSKTTFQEWATINKVLKSIIDDMREESKLGYINENKYRCLARYWKKPDKVFMTNDGQKLIVGYNTIDSGIKSEIVVYDLMGNKWQLNQVINTDEFLKTYNKLEDFYKRSTFRGMNTKIRGISEDFKTILLIGSGIAIVYRLNSDGKYQQIGQTLVEFWSRDNRQTYNILHSFLTGNIDQTGNRIALVLPKKDVVIIYDYDQQENRWIETQRISSPNDSLNAHFGKSIAFGNKGKQLLLGTNEMNHFVNIYNLDPINNQYKFFERLTTIKGYTYFGLDNPQISQDGNTIAIVSQSVNNSAGGIVVFRKDGPGIVSNVKKLSKEEQKKRKKEWKLANVERDPRVSPQLFKKLDLNSDGRISKKEMKAAEKKGWTIQSW